MISYEPQCIDILDSALVLLSDVDPADWAERKIIMPGSHPGPLRYEDTTPYTRELINFWAPTHPGRDCALMGSAQWGKTSTVVVPALGFLIENDPGPIIMTVGHESLMEEAMENIDFMLDTTELRKLIKPQSQRKKSNKTGDTDTLKRFPNGYLKLSPASNPKIWRQVSYKYGFIDDYDAVKKGTKAAGSTRQLIDKRFTAYSKTYKKMYISSPELEATSNIYEVYLLGDQRKYMVPCPCCATAIELVWETTTKDGQHAGITWNLDTESTLIIDSVGYTCQECGDFFTDQHKAQIMPKGYWMPTAKPSRPDFYSYHMSSLYSPHFMSDWTYYVGQWLECNPPSGQRDEEKYQTFLNLNLGLPYKEPGETPKASALQRNIFNYEVGAVPEKLSEAHGNGKVILITFSCDLNGKPEDARLDWEVLAHTVTGSTYSINQGSIGTFVPREGAKKNVAEREHWTYEHNKPNSVWPEVEKIMDRVYETGTGRRMQMSIAGIDMGHYDNYAWAFIEKTNHNVVGVKGKDGDRYIRFSADTKAVVPAKQKANLYLITVGIVKDAIAKAMKLKYDRDNDEKQPPGFMNYPIPSGGKYLFESYFKHYESEQRTSEQSNGELISSRWEKVTTIAQNHFWDVRVYGMALKDIWLFQLSKSAKVKQIEWSEYAAMVMGTKR